MQAHFHHFVLYRCSFIFQFQIDICLDDLIVEGCQLIQFGIDIVFKFLISRKWIDWMFTCMVWFLSFNNQLPFGCALL